MDPNLQFDPNTHQLTGPAGSLAIAASDQLAHRFLMLMEGQCLKTISLRWLKNLVFAANAITKSLTPFKQGGLPAVERKRPVPNPITAAPIKSSDRSCGIVFWIQTLHRR